MTASQKADLRRAALAQRSAVPNGLRHAFAARAACEGRAIALDTHRKVASGYWPIRGEADPLPLLRSLGGAGLRTALPVVLGRGKPLLFRLWGEGDPLSDGPFGLREPPTELPAAEPDLLFVPLAAFDRAGHRIGYGAGYYDATLAALAPKRPLAIGLAFSVQEVASIPAELHDYPLAFVITENETIVCGTPSDHAPSLHR